MKKRFSLILMLPFMLVSCNKNETFDVNKDFQLSRNGDLFSFDFTDATYLSVSNGLDADEAIASMELSEGVTFIRTSSTCQSCINFEQTFLSFIQSNMLDISVYADTAAASKYATKYIDYLGNENIEHDEEHTFLNRTPSWYYVSKEKGCKIACWGGGNDYYLKTSFFKSASITNIYKFSSVNYLKKGIEENNGALIYFLDKTDLSSVSFYKDTLYPLAKKSSKPTYILDSNRMDSSSIEDAKSYFSSYSLILNDKKASLDNQAGLNEIVNSYYN